MANKAKDYDSFTLKFMNTAINNKTKDAIKEMFTPYKNSQIYINCNLN